MDVEDFAVDRYEDCAVRRRGEFDHEFVRKGVAVLEDDFRQDFAGGAFFLPTGREVAAGGDFFGEAGRKAFSFSAVCDVGADGIFFGGAEGDVDLDVGGVVAIVVIARRLDVNGFGRAGGFSVAAAVSFAAFIFGEGRE